MSGATETLALLGGAKAITTDAGDLFRWPTVTEEDEQAVLEVLRAGSMSDSDVTRQFEAEYGTYQGTQHALAFCNGTAALLAAMYGCGVRRGDEIIAPSLTYWASALPAFGLGATVVFADIERDSLCIDPADIEARITDRTKAIVVVHYCGHPADMDPILAVARKHGVKVIEDVSHAHGALYKGRLVGSIGDVSAMSLMSGKSLPAGEAGMLCTDDRAIYEYALAMGHYERTNAELTLPELTPLAGLPLGGYKHRINQTCSAMARVQLRHYPQRMQEIQDAMNHFWDGLEGVPGLRAHRPPEGSGSTMGGWYNPLGHYLPEELGGLPVSRFIEAVNAEGGVSWRAANSPLHLHPVFNTADIYGDGRPTRIAFSDRDLRQGPGSLPVSEALAERSLGVPWFKRHRPEAIDSFIAAYRKVAMQADKLMARA
jgi:dTDP-4-amino-4,6-dideoxygalactose transaminase